MQGEAVQSFFNVNGYANPANGEHNSIRTRSQLQFYDSTIFDIVLSVFPCGNSLKSRCTRQGNERVCECAGQCTLTQRCQTVCHVRTRTIKT